MRTNGLVRFLFYQLVLSVVFYPLLISCTILPRSGPTQSDVYLSSHRRIPIIPVNEITAKLTTVTNSYPWIYSSKMQARQYETLAVSDKLEINIWENASERLYSGEQQGPANLGPLVISAKGNIYVPYLGQVKAAGITIDQLQQTLIHQLKNKVINPQVVVKKVEGLSKQISIQGVVSKPGTFEITPGRHDLISFLADAGGSTLPPELTEVLLERKGKTFKTTLSDLYHSSHKNIDLYPGDNIILSDINYSFTSLGATQIQRLIKFPKRELSLIEAVGLVDGLSDEKANPSYVFLLRYEKNQILNSIFCRRKPLLKGSSPVIYELNMRNMASVFSAQRFKVRNGDLIITVDAPYTNVRKILSSLSPAVALGTASLY